MSDDDKHRGRIFFHRGQLAQAKAAYEHAVADDRLVQNPRALSDSLGNLGNVSALWMTWIGLKPAIGMSW